VRSGSRLAILRVPGIYAADRLPLRRLAEGTPALLAADDVYTNHIHADDLARIVALALFRTLPGRVYHAVDDTHMLMADYFDTVADAFGLARPPRVARAQLAGQVTPMLLSFMSESRRMSNARMKRELGAQGGGRSDRGHGASMPASAGDGSSSASAPRSCVRRSTRGRSTGVALLRQRPISMRSP
jgi:nucleoside-diphosphate-sugar epimerase